MSRRLADLSIDEIRKRYLRSDRPVSAQLLSKLRRDPRAGVRQLTKTLERRHVRTRDQRLRLDGMLNFERVLWMSGVTRIAGVDESGMGPLAGPVVAAAVVMPPRTELADVDDSKRLDPDDRTRLAEVIRATAAGIGIGIADVGEIDSLNIYQAGLLAMRRAVEALPAPPEHILVDARKIPDLTVPQNCFNKGDGLNFSIAAASIIAKTHRDAMMLELGRLYPGYGLAQHKGYGTSEHQAAIRELGPSTIHRMSFPFIRELCGEFSPGFYQLKHRLEVAASAAALAELEAALPETKATLAEHELRKLRVMLSRRWKTLTR